MASRSTRQRVARRDRRKAKASDWRREGTANPKKVTHHLVTAHVEHRWNRKNVKQLPQRMVRTVYSDGPIGTRLGKLLRP